MGWQRVLRALSTGIVAAAMSTGVAGPLVVRASASGPAAPGKDLLTFDCVGLGSLTISVDTGGRSWGSGQMIDQQGHLSPIALTYTIVDTTTDTLLESRSFAKGHGKANQEQEPTTCTNSFSSVAAEFYEGAPLPAGVSAGDVIQFAATLQVLVLPA